MNITAPLYSQLNGALKEAIKQQDEVGKNTIRMLIAACKNAYIHAGKDLDDGDVINILVAERKRRSDSAEQYDLAGRNDLVKKEKAEIKVIERFLPQQISGDELKERIQGLIDQVGAKDIKDMGQVMTGLREQFAGQLDMKTASSLVKELLGSS